MGQFHSNSRDSFVLDRRHFKGCPHASPCSWGGPNFSLTQKGPCAQVCDCKEPKRIQAAITLSGKCRAEQTLLLQALLSSDCISLILQGVGLFEHFS